MDETYQIYLNRVARLTLPATYQSQIQHIQESPKFQPQPDGGRQPVPFPGYTVITPPWGEESENGPFYSTLKATQEQLLSSLDGGLFVPVPPDSFHLTLADLIWDSAYRHAIDKNSEFEVQMRSRIAEIFTAYQRSLKESHPILWKLLGLTIMPRAVGVCLVPHDENAYNKILQLRRSIYQNSGLIALGIEQQYGFTAHITLGYFGDVSPNLDRDDVCNALSLVNHQWLEGEPEELWSQQAELRKFDDMTRYYREPNWPVLQF